MIEAILVALRPLQRRMHRVISKVEEERLVVMPLDKCDGLACESICQILLLIGRLCPAQYRIERPQPRVNIGVAPVQKAEELVVAPLKRMKMRRHTKVPLTHRAGDVTCRLQNVRCRNLRQRQANLLSQTSGRRTGVILVAKTLLVAPGR